MGGLGHPKTGGRKAGTPNKSTLDFRETLARNNFDPAQTLLDLLEKAKLGWDNGSREEKPVYLKIAADLAKDIADRVYPRLKAIEVSKTSPLDDMTPEQKLEALKQAATIMERDVTDRRVGPGSSEDSGEKI